VEDRDLAGRNPAQTEIAFCRRSCSPGSPGLPAQRAIPGRMVVDRMAQGRNRTHPILALVAAPADPADRAGPAGQTPLDHRAEPFFSPLPARADWSYRRRGFRPTSSPAARRVRAERHNRQSTATLRIRIGCIAAGLAGGAPQRRV
jgi:hypothetical protein